MNILQALCVTYLMFVSVDGARILGWFPVASYSHQVVYLPVMTELARKGHQVLVITPNPLKDKTIPNYREIDVSSSYSHFTGFNHTAHRDSIFHCENMMQMFFSIGIAFCQHQFEDPQIQQIISPNSKEHFDVIFLEWLYLPSLYPIGLRFNAPLIGITSLPMLITNYDSLGSPAHPTLGDTYLPYTPPLSFFQRFHSFLFHIYTRFFWHFVELPKHDKLARKYFGNSIPYVGDLEGSASVVFVSSNPVFHGPRTHPPGIIEVSGLHISKPKPLPEDIEDFINSSLKGVIFFSLGSNVRSRYLAPHKRQMFLDAFAELKDYGFLWKWEDDNLPNKPDNVKISKWLPQGDILAHPRIRAFIMQGGLQSLEEAMEYSVPVIAIPFISDQGFDAQRIADLGIGIKIEHHELSKDIILNALRQLLYNSTYHENLKDLLTLTKDQPLSSMERVIWWTEYVIRHKGAKHLRSAAADLPYYQLLLLDVIGFLLLVSVILIYITYSILSFFWRLISGKNKQKTD